MYICSDCGEVFSEPKSYSDDRTPGGVFEGGSFIYHYTGCPYCEGAYEEAMECQGCGEYISTESSSPFCESCVKDLCKRYAKLIKDNFREDEYETIYDNIAEIEPYEEDKKGD